MATIPPPPPPPPPPKIWSFLRQNPVDDDDDPTYDPKQLDPTYNPDTEIDLTELSKEEIEELNKIRAERDSFYQEIRSYASMTDRRKVFLDEIEEWANILNKYITARGNEDKMRVLVSNSSHVNKAKKIRRVILLFHITKIRDKKINHEIVVEFYKDLGYIRVYDTSGYVKTPTDVRDAFDKNLNPRWRRFVDTYFPGIVTTYTFAPVDDYNTSKRHGRGQCGSYSCWIALYLVLNPTTTELEGKPPDIPSRDGVSFARYMRVCINRGTLLLPSTFADYIGNGKLRENKRNSKRKESKDWKDFLGILKHFRK